MKVNVYEAGEGTTHSIRLIETTPGYLNEFIFLTGLSIIIANCAKKESSARAVDWVAKNAAMVIRTGVFTGFFIDAWSNWLITGGNCIKYYFNYILLIAYYSLTIHKISYT